MIETKHIIECSNSINGDSAKFSEALGLENREYISFRTLIEKKFIEYTEEDGCNSMLILKKVLLDIAELSGETIDLKSALMASYIIGELYYTASSNPLQHLMMHMELKERIEDSNK